MRWVVEGCRPVFSLISFPMNYPAFIVFLFLEFSLTNPAGLSLVFHPLAPVFWLAGLWTLIGAIVYGFVRLFRMGP